ncbi:MAG: hybrid sensor histidine kinase/response regulator [Acidothermus cellulolyticus]|nr:hybrid sensor histidine kinase/response regulator [Acidothermus cellulolyticus]
MGGWAEDPELLATFRAEVEDRLASLSAGLLRLETGAASRQVLSALFRDAHTVKGSARMMGLTAVLETAHAAEDLLAALRDGRFPVRRDLVDLLLATVDGISRSLPGDPAPVGEEHLRALIAALRSALDGEDPVTVPRLPEPTVTVQGGPQPLAVPPPPAGQAAAPPLAVPPPPAGPAAAPPLAVPPPPTGPTGSPAGSTAPPPRPAGSASPPAGSAPIGRLSTPTATLSTPATAASTLLESITPPAAVQIGGPTEPERGFDAIRVASRRVYDLLDVVGEAELDARRVERNAIELETLLAEQQRWLRAVRAAATQPSEDLELALHRLVATSDQLVASGHQLRERVEDARSRLAQVRDGAMGLAMVPVRRVLSGFPRLVRDVASAGGKDVGLRLVGEDVELDKKVLDAIADALRHLVTNAVDHGCETPAERVAAGKPPRATVTVEARSAGGTVVLEVADDGRGIDESAVRRQAIERGLLPPDSTVSGPALLQVLFAPAFSTAPTVTVTSGRGVGLDVVRTVVDELGGTIDIYTEPGRGTRFVLTLPITLGVLRCLIARVGAERYAVPVPNVIESISLRDVPVDNLAGAPVVVRHGTSVPLLDLGAALGVEGVRDPRAALVVRQGGGDLVAWSVDRLEGELELVVKDLGSFIGRLPLVTGATIDGDGTVVCLLDLREMSARTGTTSTPQPATVPPELETPRPLGRRPRILVVEDSVGVRELERVILEGAGYEVTTAVDGLDGLARLRTELPDLVLADVEMPGMDGFTLTRTIRRTRGWEHLPVVIMTSRGDDGDRRAGMEAGANAYLLKSEFDQAQLVETVGRLLGR